MENKVMNQSKYINIILLILSFWIFFNHLIPGNISILILLFVTISFFFHGLISNNKVRITSSEITYITVTVLFIIIQLISIMFSTYVEDSIYRGIFTSVILIIGLLLSFNTKVTWCVSVCNYMLILSTFHALLTLYAFTFPDSFKGLIIPILPSNISNVILMFMSNGYYPGITNQISVNAFFITIGISIIISNMLMKGIKHSKKDIILFTILFVALLLTGKRGHLLANLISIVFVLVLYTKIRGASLFNRVTKLIILFSTFFILIITLIPQASAPIQRFIEKSDGDLSSGRYQLNTYAFELFKEKPIFGWGTGTFSNIYGTGNHNVYLQLLSENGVVGLLIFLVFVTFAILYTIKQYKEHFNSVSRYNNYYLFSIYIQIFFVTYGMSGNVLNDEYIFLIYAIGVAIPFSLKYLKKEVEN